MLWLGLCIIKNLEKKKKNLNQIKPSSQFGIGNWKQIDIINYNWKKESLTRLEHCRSRKWKIWDGKQSESWKEVQEIG